jgi:hypothetical protein
MNNTKKILCYNIICGKKCNYGNKCLYAHNLNEQNVDSLRETAYNILKNDKQNLSDINLIENNKLYETLCHLTKVCTLCEKKTCSGGYNCRNGAISKEFKICYDDLVYGNCKYTKCNYIHLTERGLVPYLKQKNKIRNEKIMKKGFIRTDKTNETIINKNLLDYLFMNKKNNDSDDSYGDENVEDIINYLNNDNDSSDESIFTI